MTKRYTTPQHLSDEIAAPGGMSMRSRAAAAISAGCLALALFPLAAVAAPADQGAPQGDDNGSAMQQPAGDLQAPGGSQQQAPNGQAPANMQAPTGTQQQAPNGNQAPTGNQQQAPTGTQQQAPTGTQQQAPGAPDANGQQPGQPGEGPSAERNAFDNQIRDILTSTLGITMPSFDNASNGSATAPGNPGEAPAIPDGEINVQALIDSVHDMIRQYGASSLESADFTDQSFLDELTSFVKNATDQRLQMFSTNQHPTGGAPEGMLDNASADNGTAPADASATTDGTAPQAAEMGAQLSSTALNTVVNFLVGVFGGATA